MIVLFILSNILTVLSMMYINEKSFTVVKWSLVGIFPNESTELVLSTSNVSGKIVWLAAPNYNLGVQIRPFVQQIQSLANAGCLAVITSYRKQTIPGKLVLGALENNFALPVGMVGADVYGYVQSMGGTANLTFISWDPNPWGTVYSGPGYIVFSVIVTLMYLVNSIYAIYRITKWLWTLKKDFSISLGFVCLSLEAISNLLRVLQGIVDPLRNNFGLDGADLLFSIPACITSIAGILIVFFWLDLITDPFYHGKFLGVMKIPALLLIFLLIIIEITNDFLRTTQQKIDISNISLSVYLVVQIIVVLFNIIAGYRVLRSLKENEKADNKKRITTIIRLIIYSGIVTLVGSIVLAICISPVADIPLGNIISFGFLYFSFFVQSFLLIKIFKLPKQRTNTSASGSIKDTSDISVDAVQ